LGAGGALCARAPKSVTTKNSAAVKPTRAKRSIRIFFLICRVQGPATSFLPHTFERGEIDYEKFRRGSQCAQANIRGFLVRSFSNLKEPTDE
jgi:hypothetical protein